MLKSLFHFECKTMPLVTLKFLEWFESFTQISSPNDIFKQMTIISRSQSPEGVFPTTFAEAKMAEKLVRCQIELRLEKSRLKTRHTTEMGCRINVIMRMNIQDKIYYCYYLLPLYICTKIKQSKHWPRPFFLRKMDYHNYPWQPAAENWHKICPQHQNHRSERGGGHVDGHVRS